MEQLSVQIKKAIFCPLPSLKRILSTLGRDLYRDPRYAPSDPGGKALGAMDPKVIVYIIMLVCIINVYQMNCTKQTIHNENIHYENDATVSTTQQKKGIHWTILLLFYLILIVHSKLERGDGLKSDVRAWDRVEIGFVTKMKKKN